MKPVKVAVIGHSFVRRADDFLHDSGIFNLNLDLSTHDIRFFSRSGCHARHLQQFYPNLESFKPDMVVIDVGTNDLADQDFSPQLLLDTIFIIAKRLVNNLQVKSIVVLQVLHRTTHGRFGLPQWFCYKVDEYNKLLSS